MNSILTEATYALNNMPSLKSLLGTVISWRMFELFVQNKSQLAELRNKNTFENIAEFLENLNNGTTIKCGFSIKSNVSGTLSNANDIDDKILKAVKDTKIGDTVFHHIFGTHDIDKIIPLTTRQHTKLHNEIKKVYFEEMLKNDRIRVIYDEFVKAHEKTANGGYNVFGDRVKAYEVTIVRIAIVILVLLSKNTRAQIYKQALENLQAKDEIPRIDPIKTADIPKYIEAQKQKSESKASVADDFKLYENLWR